MKYRVKYWVSQECYMDVEANGTEHARELVEDGKATGREYTTGYRELDEVDEVIAFEGDTVFP